MAIIGKIRDKSWLILVIVGGALLAFILGDWQKISGGNEPQYGYGLVDGEIVDEEAYNSAYNIAEENNRRTAMQQGQQPQPVDESQVWNTFVQDLVLKKEYEALGIDVSQNEFDSYLFGEEGFSVMPDLLENFKDPQTGMFNANLLRTRIDDMKSSEDPEVQKQWEESEKFYIEKRKREKYFDILKQGVYVTELEAREDYIAQQEKKSISYVMRSFREIEDSEIDASDKKLLAFFEKNKDDKKYENKFSMREIKFIDIAVEPSAADSAKFDEEFNKIKTAFSKTKTDSLFVMKNSERRYFVSQVGYRAEGDPNAKQGFTYPKYLDTLIKAAQIGDVIGPYQENGSMNLAKVIGKKDQLFTVRHLLISADRKDSAAVVKARKTTDSLMAVINSTNFEELVRKHSQDPGSNQTGGKYENFVDGEMVPEFSKYAKEEPIGKIGYVQTDFGFFIMEVLERKAGTVPNLAIVTKTLKPSETTISERQKIAYDLLYLLDGKLSKTEDPYKKVDLFDTLMRKEGYFARPVSIMDNSPKLGSFNSTLAEDKLLELAFSEDAAVGNLVNSPVKDNNRYIIAILSGIKVKGETHFEDVKSIIKADYITEQKTLRLTAQMRKAKSLNELTKNGKTSIQKAEITFANPQITGAGYEPEVVGALFSGLKDGQLTQPLKGKQGVYVVRIEKTLKAPESTDLSVQRNQLTGAAESKIMSEATKALVERANVVDNRRLFKIGLRY